MNGPDLRHLPSIEDAGLSDRTVASPALGYGLDRTSMPVPGDGGHAASAAYDADTTNPYDEQALREAARAGSPSPAGTSAPAGTPQRERQVLSRHEVAAAAPGHERYVAHDPSPYLSGRQAEEDVLDTRRRHTIVTAVLVFVVLTALAGAGVWALLKAWPAKDNADVAQFDTATVTKGEFLDTVDSTSLVRPFAEQAVNAKITGTIREVLVKEGDHVDEGQTLYVLENTAVSDSLNRAQQGVDEAQRTFAQKQEKLEEANRMLVTCQEDVDKAESDSERTVAEAALTSAQTLASLAEADAQTAQTTLTTMQETLDHAWQQQDALTVRSPLAGTVTEVGSRTKADTSVAGGTQLCTVSDLSKYVLEIDIPSDRRQSTRTGQEVRVSFPSIKGLDVTTTIDAIEDRDHMTIATAVLSDPDKRIESGIAAETSIILQSIPDTLMVPIGAVRYKTDRSPYLVALLDPTRGIQSDIDIRVLATNGQTAAVKAKTLQKGLAIVMPPSKDGK